MSTNLKSKLSFTLIELIIVISLISILATIVVLILNPANLFANARNSTRASDISTLQSAIFKYLADSSINSAPRDVSDFKGYTQLLATAQNNTGGNCPGGASGVTSSNTPSTVFNIDNTNNSVVANTLDISKLLNGGYLTKVPKDPLNLVDYQACFDTYSGNPLIIYSPQTEIQTTFYSSIIGTVLAFKPTFLLNLQSWYDSSQIQNITSGQPLCTWKDLSGNAIDATQAIPSLCPTYQQNYYNNNKPAVVYSNTIYQTLESNSSIFTGLNSYTIILVIQQTGGQGCQCALRTADDNIALNGGQSWQIYNNPSGVTSINSGSYQSSPSILTLTVNNLTTLNTYKNGQSIASTTATIKQAPNGYLAIGRDQSVHAFGGLISELIIYKSSLSTNDRLAVENYLNQKYNLY